MMAMIGDGKQDERQRELHVGKPHQKDMSQKPRIIARDQSDDGAQNDGADAVDRMPTSERDPAAHHDHARECPDPSGSVPSTMDGVLWNGGVRRAARSMV